MKSLIVLADGTGNSAAAFFKTNVWRLYEAIDQGAPTAPGNPTQLAHYHDGVGTSSFRPLALAGGAFGWGLKRNVLDLYTFLCRNYEPGDRIYAFGFSRGAFTIRVLIGLLATEGLVQCTGEAELARAARDAYRAHRHCFNRTRGLVGPLRRLRDVVIARWRRWNGQRLYAAVPRIPAAVDFVGVWDTVAAYGMPIAELARGIDDWIWPLSMPDYKLPDNVKRARHALALDDERDTYHPLLWDEVHEETLVRTNVIPASRIQQVWFAGMHSDVGGGYPDDGLSHVSLAWMMDEAEAAGLCFDPAAKRAVHAKADSCAPMHDSRRGVGGYYRYQPRKLSARMQKPDPRALVMHDPDLPHGLLTSVTVHESVLDRIVRSKDGYAPIVLPHDYTVAPPHTTPLESPARAAARADAQERVWNDVWRKRLSYFATVALSVVLALMPVWASWLPVSVAPQQCEGPQCLLAPVIRSTAVVLPSFAGTWIDAFAGSPGWFALLVAAITLVTMRSSALQVKTRDDQRALWRSPDDDAEPPSDWIYRMRTAQWYQHGLQKLKWNLLPGAFGLATLGALGGAAIVFVGLLIYRGEVVLAEHGYVSQTLTAPSSATPSTRFRTDSVTWDSGRDVIAHHRYEVRMTVTEDWKDRTIPASPRGFLNDRMPWFAKLAFVGRRSMTHRWFQPFAKVVGPDGTSLYPLEMRRLDTDSRTYVGDFQPAHDGRVQLFVNDAVIDRWGLTTSYYANNAGAADVEIDELPRP